MKLPDFFKHINLYTLLIAILTFALGWQLGHRDVAVKWDTYKPTVSIEDKDPPGNINVDFKLFWDTWDLLSRNYLDKKALDPNKMLYGAIQGMVASLGDPYTVFLPPVQQKSSKEDLGGSFEGVGIELGFNKDKRLVVMAPLSGTPAQKAGIKPADVIIKIDDKDTTNMSLIDAVNIIRGPKGTDVMLTIYRDGATNTQDFKLTRDTIVVKSVESSTMKTKSGKLISIIKLSRFGERTDQEWQDAVSKTLSEGATGIILDLRNNPGGFLDGAVFIASEFLDGGNVVLQENAQGQRSAYQVDRVGKLLNLPLVVLINKGSASASEIVSGAMQDRKRGTLVGEKSFGKGTIQETEDLPGGTGIHITIAKWLTPNGRWVNSMQGLDPDVLVKPATDSSKIGASADPQIQKALEILDNQ